MLTKISKRRNKVKRTTRNNTHHTRKKRLQSIKKKV